MIVQLFCPRQAQPAHPLPLSAHPPPCGTAIHLPQFPQSYHRLGSQLPHMPGEGFTVREFGNLETSSLTTLTSRVMCSLLDYF